jgi:leader peptidase (prepilin peptidase) / N-methyltransferase
VTQLPKGLAAVNSNIARASAGFFVVFAAIALPGLFTSAMPAGALVASAVLAAGLAVLTAIDIKTYRLPDVITLPLLALGLAFAVALDFEPAVTWRAGAAAAGYLFIRLVDWAYRRIRNKTGIGEGDAKLFAAAGAWVGPQGLSGTLLYACAVALLFVAVQAMLGRKTTGADQIPFGPFLALGLWLTWVYGPLVW